MKIKGKTEFVVMSGTAEVYRGNDFLTAAKEADEVRSDSPDANVAINKETHYISVDNVFSTEKN